MTCPEQQNSELRYLPFWTLYDYLDDTPPHPFVTVYIQDTYVRNAKSSDGPVSYDAVTLAIHKPDSGLIAQNIPAEMLIRPDDLGIWSDRIAKWFTDHANELANAES